MSYATIREVLNSERPYEALCDCDRERLRAVLNSETPWNSLYPEHINRQEYIPKTNSSEEYGYGGVIDIGYRSDVKSNTFIDVFCPKCSADRKLYISNVGKLVCSSCKTKYDIKLPQNK